MENTVLIVTIGDRTKSETFLSFFKEKGIIFNLGTYGRGTARKETLEYLGLGKTDKCVIFSLSTEENSKAILKELERNLGMKKVGVGLSFTVPLASVSSKKALNMMVGEVKEEEEGYIVDTENEVIVVILNRGESDLVMEAARSEGAGGGTVIHARGTGMENSEKFFGTTIGAEKEMIFIVTKASKRSAIMNAIKEKAGPKTPAGAVSFSLPIIDTAGFIEYDD